ncbi:MAG: hypothetical protein ABIH09_04195 [Candidatus Omnitrophota bacterium]
MKTKRFSVVSTLFVFLSGVLTVPLFAAEEKASEAAGQTGIIQSVFDSIKTSLTQLSGYLPKLGGLALILIIGALAAVIVTVLIQKLFTIIRLEKLAQKLKIPKILKKGGIELSLSKLIGEIIFFLVVICTLIAALEFYGLATPLIMSQILSYVPHVVTAVFILILGGFLAIFISGVIAIIGENVRIAQSATLGRIAKYAILIFAGLNALKELGLGVILTDSSNDIILGGLVLAFAVAFGFGAKEKAGNFLSNVFKK